MGWVVLMYFVGMFVSMFVFKARSGMGMMGMPELDGAGIAWSVKAMGKSLVWPLVLGAWLANGRPDDPGIYRRPH